MSGKKKVGGAGLRGQVAGQSAICTVGVSGSGLTYRGYDLQDLVENATFEEVAFLLLHGELPKQSELDAFIDRMVSLRHLPKSLRLTLENIPKNTHPMDVMRTGCSMLGNIEPEEDFSQQIDKAERMLAAFPAILNYWYNFSHKGVKIETELDDRSIGGYFLHTLHGKKPSELHATIMNTSLILYAEHEFNASTFAARVCASTLSDIHSSVTAAIGTLRGPLHGGANESAHAMISQWSDLDEAEAAVMGMLERKDLIMGFGHAVYTESDPRNVIIKGCSKQLSDSVGDKYMYKVSERVEEVMWREKKLFANADFYHASSYEFMGSPVKLFTPIFVCSRVIGWTAHIFEQRSNNRIIRPTSEYTGPDLRKVNPISER